MTGVLLADYFAIRRRALHLANFYIDGATSGYCYTARFSCCAFVSWAMELRPLLPGLVGTISAVSPNLPA